MANVPEVFHEMGITRGIADAVVNHAFSKADNFLVYVTCALNTSLPLAIRTVGMGNDILGQEVRLGLAKMSARYVATAMRNGIAQREYESLPNILRTPSSYGLFDDSFIGGGVYLKDEGLVVTLISNKLKVVDAERTVEDALAVTGNGLVGGDTVLNTLVDELAKRKDSTASGLVMVGLMGVRDNHGNPIITDTQAVGPLSQGIFDVVGAKMNAVVLTGKDSGPENRTRPDISRIPGGVAAKINGESRVVAVGGLRPGQRDLELIQEVLAKVN